MKNLFMLIFMFRNGIVNDKRIRKRCPLCNFMVLYGNIKRHIKVRMFLLYFLDCIFHLVNDICIQTSKNNYFCMFCVRIVMLRMGSNVSIVHVPFC